MVWLYLVLFVDLVGWLDSNFWVLRQGVAKLSRLASNSQSFYLGLPSASVIGMPHIPESKSVFKNPLSPAAERSLSSAVASTEERGPTAGHSSSPSHSASVLGEIPESTDSEQIQCDPSGQRLNPGRTFPKVPLPQGEQSTDPPLVPGLRGRRVGPTPWSPAEQVTMVGPLTGTHSHLQGYMAIPGNNSRKFQERGHGVLPLP